MALISVNPASGEVIARHAEDDEAAIERKLAAVAAAMEPWGSTSAADRGEILAAVADRVRAQRKELSELVATEMGKPIVQAELEVDRFAARCGYFGDKLDELLAPELVDIDGRAHAIRFDPLGPALGIMPWNYPIGLASRWLVGALAAGNTALLKHASNVTLCAQALLGLFRDAGVPAGVFEVLLVSGGRMEAVIGDPRVASVSVTGSAETGARVGEVAGRALKKTVMELGGSDPFIVLRDADLDAAAAAAAKSRLQNSGQTCTAAKRIIVDTVVADAFEERLVQAFRDQIVGDPLDRDTTVGPLISADAVAEMAGQVEATVGEGASVVFQATEIPNAGAFFPPTVLRDVEPHMTVAKDETFGPVAAIIRADGEAAAVRLANTSEFGLASNVWTGDPDRGMELAIRLQVGLVGINGAVGPDPRVPFGGVKKSGYGREMSGHGLRELTNIKTVALSPAER